MTKQDNRVKVAILAVPEVTASALFGMFDLFSSPGRDFPSSLRAKPARSECTRSSFR